MSSHKADRVSSGSSKDTALFCCCTGWNSRFS